MQGLEQKGSLAGDLAEKSTSGFRSSSASLYGRLTIRVSYAETSVLRCLLFCKGVQTELRRGRRCLLAQPC
jgi:hypothetical protein